jgi:hypothetical protein
VQDNTQSHQALQSDEAIESFHKQRIASPYLTESLRRQLRLQEPGGEIESAPLEPAGSGDADHEDSSQQIRKLLQGIADPLPKERPYER